MPARRFSGTRHLLYPFPDRTRRILLLRAHLQTVWLKVPLAKNEPRESGLIHSPSLTEHAAPRHRCRHRRRCLSFFSDAGVKPSMSEGSTASGPSVFGSQGNRLRLEDCPNCGCRLICIRSKQPETFNQMFFKCPNNVRGDPNTCGWIRSERQYETYLRVLDARKQQCGDLQVIGDARMQALFELKDQFVELKNQFDGLKTKIEAMNMQIWELSQQLSERKKTWVAVLVACVAVVGLMVTVLWK